MPPSIFILGASCDCTTTDASRGIAAGMKMIVSAVNNDRSGNKATILHLRTAAEATAVRKYVTGEDTSPAAQAAHDSAVAAAVATTTDVERSRSGIFPMTSQWRDLFTPLAPLPAGGGADPLIGTVIRGMSIPIIDAGGSVTDIYSGDATVGACAGDPASYMLSFTHGSVSLTTKVTKSVVQRHASSSSAAGAVPIAIDPAVATPLVVQLLRALPVSSTQPAGKVCAIADPPPLRLPPRDRQPAGSTLSGMLNLSADELGDSLASSGESRGKERSHRTIHGASAAAAARAARTLERSLERSGELTAAKPLPAFKRAPLEPITDEQAQASVPLQPPHHSFFVPSSSRLAARHVVSDGGDNTIVSNHRDDV